MTDHERDPLIDELRAALDVTPSAEFAARVREAAAAAPPRFWMRQELLAALALAGAALFVIAVVTRHHEPQRSSGNDATVGNPSPSPVAAVDRAPAIPGSDAAATRRPLRLAYSVASDRTARRPAEPEVIVSPDEQRALRRLVETLQSDGAVPSSLAEAPPSSPDSPASDAAAQPPSAVVPPALISVAPIEVPFLKSAAPGGREEKQR
jgi:hypothetical protein